MALKTKIGFSNQLKRAQYFVAPPLGGLNTKENARNIPPGMAVSAINVSYDEPGTIQKRLGYAKANASVLGTGALVNLLSNPGFETYTGSGNTTDFGTWGERRSGTGVVQAYTADKHGGSACANLYVPGLEDEGWLEYPVHYGEATPTYVSVDEARTYLFSLWEKKIAGTLDDYDIMIFCYDSAGNNLGNTYTNFQNLTAPTSWTERSLAIYPSTSSNAYRWMVGTTKIYIWIRLMATATLGGSLLVDDASFGTSPGILHSLGRFYKGDGNKYFYFGTGDALKTLSEDYATATALVSGGMYPPYYFEHFTDKYIIGQDSDKPYKSDGTATGTVSITGAPKARYPCEHKNYLFLGRGTDASALKPTREYFSNLLDPDTWGASDYIDVGAFDGEEITGEVSFFGIKTTFKENSIWNLYGDSPLSFELKRQVDGVGCSSPRSIQKTDKGVVFLHNQKGLCFYDGNIYKSLSENLIPDEIPGNIASYKTVVSSYNNDIYKMAYEPKDLTGGATRLLTYDFKTASFSFDSETPVSSLLCFNKAGEEGRTFWGSRAGDYIYQFSGSLFTDNTVAIPLTWQSGIIAVGNPIGYNKIKRAFIEVEATGATNLIFSTAFDGSTSFTANTIALVSGVNLVDVAINQRCKEIQFKFYNSSAYNVKIHRLGFSYLPKKVAK